MLQLDPPLPVTTPKGPALAHVLIDYGAEHDLVWVCFQDNGECWCWRNQDIRATTNTVNLAAHGFTAGTALPFFNIVTTTGLIESRRY